MKPIGVPGTTALQASVQQQNKVVSSYNSVWKQLLVSVEYSTLERAKGQVKAEYQRFLSTSPSAETVDKVRGWLIDNAKDAPSLMALLDAPR